MSEELKQTVRILRRAKVASDERGRTVWLDPVEPTELELVSTTMLERVLSSGDASRKQQIRDAASGRDGVLAIDVKSDSFEIIDDAELLAMLDMQPRGMDAIKAADVVYEFIDDPADDAEELSLVSTQALRRILKIEDEPALDLEASDDRGFNPYDNS